MEAICSEILSCCHLAPFLISRTPDALDELQIENDAIFAMITEDN